MIIRTTTQSRARSSSSPAASTSVWKRRRTPVAHVAAVLLPAVPQHRRGLEVGVARHRLGVDHQPGLAVAREHVLVVQVAVDDPADARRVGDEVATEGERLLDQPARDRRVARQGGERVQPLLDERRDGAQLRQGRPVDPGVEPRHDLAGLEVPHSVRSRRCRRSSRSARRRGSARSSRTTPSPCQCCSASASCSDSSSPSKLDLQHRRHARRPYGPAPPASRSRATGRRPRGSAPTRRAASANSRGSRSSQSAQSGPRPRCSSRPSGSSIDMRVIVARRADAADARRRPVSSGCEGRSGGGAPGRDVALRWQRSETSKRSNGCRLRPKASSELQRGAAQRQRAVQVGRVDEPGREASLLATPDAGRVLRSSTRSA